MYNFTQFEQLLQVIEALKQPNVDLETFHVFAPYVAYPTSHSLGSKPFSGSSIGPQILLTKRVEQMEIARMQVNRQPPPVPPRHNLPNYGQTANPLLIIRIRNTIVNMKKTMEKMMKKRKMLQTLVRIIKIHVLVLDTLILWIILFQAHEWLIISSLITWLPEWTRLVMITS